MTPIALVLAQAEQRLVERVIALGERIDAGEDVWGQYLPSVDTLKRLVGDERTPLLTTKQAAEKFGVAPRTIRKRGKRLGLEMVRGGDRGRAAIRWRA